MVKVNRYISPKWENKSFSVYLVSVRGEKGGRDEINVFIYINIALRRLNNMC